MRTFDDALGRKWEVVVGRESWGVTVAMFIPADGGDDVRETPLEVDGYEEGIAEVEALDERGLKDIFERSRAKKME